MRRTLLKIFKIVLRGFGVCVLALLLAALWLLGLGAFNRHRYAVRARVDRAARVPAQFYVSPNGSDDNPGTSPVLAWKTTNKVNHESFVPGDSILFEGGQQFVGGIELRADDWGTANHPIRVGSFGSGTATIATSSGNAILIYNTGGISIQNLKLKGSGRAENGIILYNDLYGAVRIPHVHIDSVEASGFTKYGIGVEGNAWGSGFSDVQITHAKAHDNVLAGMYVFAAYSSFLPLHFGRPHRDIYIADSEAYSNSGIEGPEKGNTGSGIVLSALDNGIIERSVAYNNGFKSNSKAGGPVGIWAWDADGVTIQFNRSFNNRTGGPFDGGGFDLDGGVTHSVMQYNYSSGNDGAGYLVCRFPNGDPTANNVVRYNMSVNDGRKNSYGALFLFGGVDQLEVYNNTVVVDRAEIGRPVDVKIQGPTHEVHFRNNLFYSGEGLSSVRVEEPQQINLLFQGNAYISPAGEPVIEWAGKTFRGLAQWHQAVDQETVVGKVVGVQARRTVESPEPHKPVGSFSSLAPDLSGAGLDLKALFGINPGERDYCGTPLGSTKFDIGAQQLTPKPYRSSLNCSPVLWSWNE